MLAWAALNGASVPARALEATRFPVLWADRWPEDLVEYVSPDPPPTDEVLDRVLDYWVVVADPSAEVDADGCRSIPLTYLLTDPPRASVGLPWFDPFTGASGAVEGEAESARLCDGPDGPATIVEIVGELRWGGPFRMYVARPAADRSFHSIAVEYSLGFCYVTTPATGFPAPPGEVGPYLEQAWNLEADPSVDCADRSGPPVVVPSTSTTSSTTSTTAPTSMTAPTSTSMTAPTSTSTTASTSSTTSTTTTAAVATGRTATAAVPVSGSAGYAG
jgi:hypothetical protein